MSNLEQPIPYRPTRDQKIALERLEDIGYNKSLFIRSAIDEKLFREYRLLLRKAKLKAKKIDDQMANKKKRFNDNVVSMVVCSEEIYELWIH